jgi:hypothetical protein
VQGVLTAAPIASRVFIVGSGILLGVAYTLSPLTVWFAGGAFLLSRALLRDLPPTERRILAVIFAVAVISRLLILGGLFLSVDHTATPFGSLFGDEEYFKRRSLWLRSMALDVNISEADRRYATDEYSETSYLYLLAVIQVLVGDAPYGVHLFSLLAYLAGAVWLFRLVRSVYGAAPAALAFFGVLFLPTLFAWSLSALRESLHFLLTVAAIAGTSVALSRGQRRERTIGVVVTAVALYGLKDLRVGSMAVMAVSLMLGVIATFAAVGWRRVVGVSAAGVLVVAFAASRPAVQQRVMTTLHETAMNHQGHVWTPGVHYKVLDMRFYRERTGGVMDDMTWAEAARYVTRALGAAAVVPMPWQAETRLVKAYLPEHALWLTMIVLAPVGLWAGMRRHPPATFLMAAYIAVMFTGVALRSGNVGTLVRHRGLVLPFVICLAAVAVCHLLARRSSPTFPWKGTRSNGAD